MSGDWRGGNKWKTNYNNYNNYNQGFNNRGRPPTGILIDGIPSWEKKFCWKNGMPWRRFLEVHEGIDCYENVMKWDDKEAEEAFHDAKACFFAEFNGRMSDVPLPNPDMYIDHVDWTAKLDPQLMKDLESEEWQPEGTNEEVVILPYELRTEDYQLKNPQGWGDMKSVNRGWDSVPSDDDKPTKIGWDVNEDNPTKTGCNVLEDKHINSGWGTYNEKKPIETDNSWSQRNANDNPWELGKTEVNAVRDMKPDEKDNRWFQRNTGGNPWELGNNEWNAYKDVKQCHTGDNSVQGSAAVDGWGQPATQSWGSYRGRSNHFQSDNSNFLGGNGGWGSWNDNRRKRENSGQYMSRYKTTRFQGGEYHNNMNWNNNKGRKRVNVPYEQANKLIPRQWTTHSGEPVSHQRSGEVGKSWV